MDNKVVSRLKDGRALKGVTSNFSPARETFHLVTADRQIMEVKLEDCKALFFVKDYAGNREYNEKKLFDIAKVYGRKIICEFSDGEVLLGYTQGYDPERRGFFMVPADPKSNNEKIFVVASATRRITTLK
jgi:hypothetical protein